ncbi:MAG: glycosyltransferase family 39 protein [Armatimonadota bacterium]|nr:MAG: glycosyltransferase family 39 protein [Armatimonadota bacterium]
MPEHMRHAKSANTEAATDDPGVTSSRRLVWIGVALALLVGLPFLTKAFHIDDTVVLTVAEQITRDPARPFHASINWFGDPQPIFRETTNPPLVSYYLAPVVAASGFAEVPLHAAMLLYLVILGVATAALSRRFAGGSVWPVLFVMLSPAVVPSTNVMRDVPLAAVSAAAAALFIVGVDRQSRQLVVAGSVVAGLAVLTKYSGAVLLPVLALYALLQRRGRYALWLLLPLAMLGLWSLHNQLVQGRTHLGYLFAERRNDVPISDRLYATVVIVGASLYLLPALVADVLRRRRVWLLVCAVAGAGLAFLGGWLHNEREVGWQYTLWLTTGGALIALLLVPGLAAARGALSRDYRTGADTLFLALWAGAILAFGVLFVMFQAVRHVIPAVPPLALLGVRLLHRGTARAAWRSWVLGVLVAGQAAVAFAVAAADYEYARTYRDFALRAQERLPRDGREIWFSGNWGWQRHALSAGFTLIAEHGRLPRVGDLILIPDRVHRGPLPEGLELEQIEEKTYRGRIPIHTMVSSGASFYSVTSHSVPYAFTRERDLETFRVFRVESVARPES